MAEEDVFSEPLYGQAAELELLNVLRPLIAEATAIDVGAERGDVAAALLAGGWGPLTLIEASPRGARALAARFGDRDDVRLLALAAADGNGSLSIREARTAAGAAAPAFDSAVADSGEEHDFSEPIEVEARALASLAETGEIPAAPGLLKVDVEGMEERVLAGAEGLRPELLMVEHWLELPGSHGRCPWSFEQLARRAAALGLDRWTIFVHGEIHTRIGIGEDGPEPGEWSNVVFYGDRLDDAVAAAVQPIRLGLERRLVAKAEGYRAAAEKRLEVVRELEDVAAERLELIEQLERAAAERLRSLEQVSAELERLRGGEREGG